MDPAAAAAAAAKDDEDDLAAALERDLDGAAGAVLCSRGGWIGGWGLTDAIHLPLAAGEGGEDGGEGQGEEEEEDLAAALEDELAAEPAAAAKPVKDLDREELSDLEDSENGAAVSNPDIAPLLLSRPGCQPGPTSPAVLLCAL